MWKKNRIYIPKLIFNNISPVYVYFQAYCKTMSILLTFY